MNSIYVISSRYKLLLMLLAVILLSSCSKKETATDGQSTKKNQKSCDCKSNEVYPDIPGEPITFTNKATGRQYTIIKKKDVYIMDGDVLLTEEQVNSLRNTVEHPAQPIEKWQATADKNGVIRIPSSKTSKGDAGTYRTGTTLVEKLWPNRTVYYTINPALSNPSRVTNAISQWQYFTNLTFVQRTTQTNYVEFMFADSSCSSQLGMIGGRQIINVGPGCGSTEITHEIGHAIGFYHEHARPDRGNYVIIHNENIKPEAKYYYQFQTYEETNNGWGFQLGTFDFESIMLYSSYSFTKQQNPPLPTITRLDGSLIYPNLILSQGDVETYNFMYNPAPLFARLEYKNKETIVWGPWNNYTTTADISLAFYSDAACTIPVTPHAAIQFYVQMSYSGNDNTYISTTRNPNNSTYYMGKFELERSTPDPNGGSELSGMTLRLISGVGYQTQPDFEYH